MDPLRYFHDTHNFLSIFVDDNRRHSKRQPLNGLIKNSNGALPRFSPGFNITTNHLSSISPRFVARPDRTKKSLHISYFRPPSTAVETMWCWKSVWPSPQASLTSRLMSAYHSSRFIET